MFDLTLWAGRVATGLAPEVWAFLRADDAELLPYDLQATLLHAGRLHEAGILDDAELAEVAEKLAAIDTIDADAGAAAPEGHSASGSASGEERSWPSGCCA